MYIFSKLSALFLLLEDIVVDVPESRKTKKTNFKVEEIRQSEAIKRMFKQMSESI